ALAHASPIFDDGGRVLGAVNVVVDISERRRAEELLKEADRHKNEFLAILSHELRTPLAPIRNALQVLNLKSPPDPELQNVLGLIDRQIRQMTRLVDDLLDISRIIRRQLELRTEQVGLSEIVYEAVEASQPLLEMYGQDFNFTVPADPVYLNADRARLAQVVSNLLNNAAKYTGADGSITLTAERRGEEAVITVRDTGIGIPVEVQSDIFEMFKQADRTSGQSKTGLGIGLTLVKRLVEMHGGSITVNSAGRDRGSEFVVRLPVADKPAHKPEPEHDKTGRAASNTSLRILVVDDDRDSTTSLSMLLQIMGHKVRTAHDGPEAIGTAAEYRPDIVLLDIGLPGMNGYEVARRIRRAPWSSRMTLIALTGWGQEEDRRQSEEAGFDHHLVKPVEAPALSGLLASIKQVLQD
ncbi:MAG TPA: ATP-binding protein, partial [Gammaproteobacteria bacterium]